MHFFMKVLPDRMIPQEDAPLLVQNLMALSEDGMLIFDDALRLIESNARASQMLLLDDASGSLLDSLVELILEGTLTCELSLPGNIIVRMSAHEPGAQRKYWMVILRDLTESRAMQRKELDAISVFLHDIRSPLSAATGYLGLMEQGGETLSPVQREYADLILTSLRNIASQVENVNDAGRYEPETGTYEVQYELIDLNDMVSRAVRDAVIPPDKRTLKITVECADNVPLITGDRHMLERAIVNLIDNAIKYTFGDGSIHISLMMSEGQVVFTVRDSGIGIRPEDQERLFQRHSRLLNPRAKHVRGSGLGLYIVRLVAQQHGGQVSVSSEENKGSAFVMRLPVRAEVGGLA
ncbi:MAG: HAMP domain-containing histidine kinase [Pleurocapsa minor GSE-CHR-MK-17-07R]|jgi:signal transduction histidine kinase|nr:HAMP domain-containing histidine kinase [Pleurocapsa minor GSE-CHR-MK 17-07R]